MVVGRILLIWPYIGFGCAEFPKIAGLVIETKKKSTLILFM